MNPKSRGEVRIQSSNPLDLPLIDPNFLSHSDDIDVMLNAVKLARKVIQTKPLSILFWKKQCLVNQLILMKI
jgi:choline dehydrogenase-like flavoprotein